MDCQCYQYAKMALRDLRGTAPGTAQRFLDCANYPVCTYGRENVQQVHCQLRCCAVLCCAAAAHARASMRRRRNLTGQWRRPHSDGTPDSMQAISIVAAPQKAREARSHQRWCWRHAPGRQQTSHVRAQYVCLS